MIADHTVTVSDGVQDIVFDVVAHVEDGDYSWSAEAVFWFEDSGCSCYGFADSATVADLTPLHKFSDAYSHTTDRERLDRSRELGEIEWR